MTTAFPEFSAELRGHSAAGYHLVHDRYSEQALTDWVQQNSLNVSEEYLRFLAEIGCGRFFAGSFTLFCLGESDGRDVLAMTARLSPAMQPRLLCVGYDGTTSGCYCIDKVSGDDAVWWYSWEDDSATPVSDDFARWVESLPGMLFSKKIFAGYKPVRDLTAIREVIRKRAAFRLTLLEADRELVCPPDRPNDFLPRYNRLRLEVVKQRDSSLTHYTFKVLRTGSKVGAANVEYATADVTCCVVGEAKTIDVFVFDPFNQQFISIVPDFAAEIDLGTPQRVKYREIVDFL